MRLSLVVGLGAGLVVAAAGGAGAQAAAPTADSIVLERTRCFGACPAYRLVLARAGALRFESRSAGDSGRTARDSVSPAVFAGVLAAAERAGFDSLPARIDADHDLCATELTDHPTATVTIFRAGAARRVEDYHGCFDSARVPSAAERARSQLWRLRQFEEAIDDAARSDRWLR